MSGKKVLVVDDSVSIRKSIGFVLGQEGYEITEAVDGIDGLAKAKSDKFSLVITDINMPNMDGIELTKNLRQTEGYRFIPIIALTTENQQSKMTEGKTAGATGWIVKPFTSEKLIAVVKKVIN
jgi:two-component system, chemotaxis family, chemotaxis protein CheY